MTGAGWSEDDDEAERRESEDELESCCQGRNINCGHHYGLQNRGHLPRSYRREENMDAIACTKGDQCWCDDARECGNAYPMPEKDWHRTGKCGDVCPNCEFHPEAICGKDCSGCCNDAEFAS